MVFCNLDSSKKNNGLTKVTILILIDGFLQYAFIDGDIIYDKKVTILILIDGFLQYVKKDGKKPKEALSQSLF